jgi:hypothetical protein
MQDADTNERKQAKSIDPIWKILQITRILCVIWLIAILIFLYFVVKDQGIHAYVFIIFALIYGIFPAFLQFTQERHWNSIAQRRSQALYHPEALLTSVLSKPTSDESKLKLPLHIQLRRSSKMMVLMVSLLISIVIAGIIFGALSSGSNKPLHLGPLLIALGSIIAVLLIVGVFFFFIQARYFTQTFDITAEGITTRYLNQQRSIRWNEVRIFARYTPRGWNAAALGNIYELANDQTVVRWAQRPNVGTVVKSSQPEYDDFNWLGGQITTLVMARSGQPLLNLDEKHPSKQRATSGQAAATEAATLQNVPPIGQDDPIINKITARNGMMSVLVFGVLGIGIMLLGVLDRNNTSPLLFRYGIFVLLLALLVLVSVPRTRRYWLTIQHRRQIAVQHPEDGLATPQPGPSQEQPQPAQLYISMSIRSQKQAFKVFGTVFLIFLVLAEFIVFSLNPLYQLAMLIGSLLLGLLAALSGAFMRNKSNMQRIDVSTNGIASHYLTNDAQINWHDARLFATYKNIKLLNRGAPPNQIYELVGEQAVVRWSKQRMPIKAITTEPAMSGEEYERWLEQLHGYITERTQLPLHDLDKAFD